MSKPVKTILVLRAARKLVADPDTWTSLSLARDVANNHVEVNSAYAVRWCATGAVDRACYLFGVSQVDAVPLHEALDRTAKLKHGNHQLISVNDNFGRKAALSILDAAIQELADA